MRTFKRLGLGLIASAGLVSAGTIAQAVQLQDGRVYFENPPRLEGASTTRQQTARSGGTYYFTLEIPDSAGEPLQNVVIAQQDGDSPLGRVEFEADETIAFQGTRRDRGEAIAVENATFDEATRSITVTLAPVQPGTTVTIGVRPERNPRLEGVYLFGVTAFPAGDQANGQFLGYGRLDFFNSDGSQFFN